MSLSLLPGPDAAQGPDAEVRTVVQGADFVTGIAFTSDGRMVFNEREGRVLLVQDGRLRSEPIAEIPTSTDGESGLLGVATPPDVERDPAVYVFATAPDGESNRVLRVPLDLSEPEVVVEGLPAGTYHNGGGLVFDAGGRLLVTNGEQHDSGRAQDPDALGGKIYRFEPDGSIPSDNPFASPALALGLRNPYGIALDPLSDAVFVTENGPDSHDEINRIEPGGNYGWPDVSGSASGESPTGPGEYHDPVLDYESTIVPTGIAFAEPGEAEPEFAGDLFFGAYGRETIQRVRLSDDRTAALSDDVLLDVGDPVLALAWGPKGLYFSTPDAIRLLPLARGAAADEPDPMITMAPDDDGPLGGRNLLVLAVVTLAAGWFLVRNRRKFRS
ncbi:MAG: PQQ-dependent sugar dehydrogenase [Actinomycetota bacterium]